MPEIIARGIQRLLFDAFPASWYIIASVIAMLILYWIPKKYNKLMLIFSFALYLIDCISSNYYYLFEADNVVIKFVEIYTPIFNVPHLSFLVAFIWMGIGKACAESEFAITPAVRRVGIVISATMLYLEHFVIRTFSLSRENDCYIMLVPLCFFIFLELKSADYFKIRNAVTLRKMSTIIYCSHMTVMRVCSGILKYVIYYRNNGIIFAMTVLICIAESLVILKLEKKKRFARLKYSH